MPVAKLLNGSDEQKEQLLTALRAGVPEHLHDQIALNRVLMRTGTGETSLILNPDIETPLHTVELAHDACLAADLGSVERGAWRPSNHEGRIRVIGYGVSQEVWVECCKMFTLFTEVNRAPIFHLAIPAEVEDLTLQPCPYLEVHMSKGPNDVRNLQMAAGLTYDLRHIVEVELWHPEGMHYYAIGDGIVNISIGGATTSK